MSQKADIGRRRRTACGMLSAMAVLVTGATGFVMANLVRHLAGIGSDVVAADRAQPDDRLRQFLEGHRGRVRYRQVDVTDRAAVEALARDVRPDRAVHGAALTPIPLDAERARFLETCAVNVMGTLNVLAALADVGTGRIVAISSGSVYGRREDLSPIAEDEGKDPQALYPMTKWGADMLARRFAQVRALELAVARLASPFGPFERDTGSRPLLSPIAHWAPAALRGDPVIVQGEPTYRRDIVYVDDVASGIAAILFAGHLPHDAYNIGWGRGASAEETVAALGRLVPDLAVEWRPDEPSPWLGAGNVARGPLVCDRLRRDFGWEPRYDLESGLAAYLGWLRGRASRR
jgi:nucleoside-diphosphate-sugar epimerase